MSLGSEQVIDGVVYVATPPRMIGNCSGCAALGEVKRVTNSGGKVSDTVCARLGPSCLRDGKNFIWVVKK